MVETLITSVVHPFWIITGLLPKRIALWVKIQLVLMSLLVGTLNREISIEYIRLACLASVEKALGDSYMKRAGMLVVSLRGVNLGFWSRLGCPGQKAIIFSPKGLFQCCTRRNFEKLYIFNSFYLLDSCNQSLK